MQFSYIRGVYFWYREEAVEEFCSRVQDRSSCRILNKKFCPYIASHENCFSVRVSLWIETAIYSGFWRIKENSSHRKSGIEAVSIHIEIRNKKQFCHVLRGKERNFYCSKSGIKAVLNTWTRIFHEIWPDFNFMVQSWTCLSLTVISLYGKNWPQEFINLNWAVLLPSSAVLRTDSFCDQDEILNY